MNTQDRIRELVADQRELGKRGEAYLDAVVLDALDALLATADPSDEYHPVLGFDGAASDSLENTVNAMEGFGVTLTLEDGSEIEAVLLGLEYDETNDRQLTKFYRAADDNDFPAVSEIDPDDVEYAFATRIQVS